MGNCICSKMKDDIRDLQKDVEILKVKNVQHAHSSLLHTSVLENHDVCISRRGSIDVTQLHREIDKLKHDNNKLTKQVQTYGMLISGNSSDIGSKQSSTSLQ